MENTNSISLSFKYGHNLKIGHYNVIEKGVAVGNNTIIGNFCEIGKHVKIGNNVILQGRVRIASDTTIEDGCVLKYGTIITNRTLLKRNVFMGPNTITLGGIHTRESIHGTVIGENGYIGAGSQIAANTRICNDVVLGTFTFANKDIIKPGIYVGIPARFLKAMEGV